MRKWRCRLGTIWSISSRLQLYISSWVFTEGKPATCLYSPLYAMVFNRAFVVTVVFLTTLVNAATYTGRIQVVNSNGGSYGFLKNDASGL